MKIIDSLHNGQQFISLEYFPPKSREDWPAFFQTVERLSCLNPKFVSVTYGAGGSTHSDSLEIVTRLKQEYNQETMAHLTCIGSTEMEIACFLDRLAAAGVSNILALRGDLPVGQSEKPMNGGKLEFASDLVQCVHESFPEFGIAVACYPETHPEAISPESDLASLKLKLDKGGDYAITQLFFDNSLYYDFVKRARAAGIMHPVVPGILPVVSLKVIKRIVSLCGASIPQMLLTELEEADKKGGAEAVQKVGIAYARKQAEDLLANGVPGIHLYTLNRSDAILELVSGLL